MKISYFGYYLQHKISNESHLIDLSGFLSSFAEFDSPQFKGSFRHNGEHIYLQRLLGNVCVLIMTRDSEKFKKINTTNLSISEINKILGQDEKIGFASYIILKEYYFGFSSTSLSPKFDAFTNLINELLNYTENGSWSFCIKPLIYQATKEQAVKMEYIGRTTIEVTQKNTLAKHFLNVFTGEADTEELESIEIILKPRRMRSIKPLIEKVVEATSSDGLEKFMIKAKNDASSAMLDIYVAGKGVISDDLGSRDEKDIPGIIEEKIRENNQLQEQLKAFTENGQTNKVDFSRILRFSDVHTWANLAADLQNRYKLSP
ncbi:hypothetical protein [Azotobacter salinestris]|uniref:hypothetical protein n=1 Tax=Azotobacter salinestris TaxID=69964 RepID=UPI001266E1BC|nr:hypothetical protein [Azotobacter salinestris]